MELSQAHLRYLLAIGRLAREQAAVSSAQVARALQVSRPSVTRMLTVLAEKDLVTKARYGKITLTETGAALAHQLQAGLRDLERRLPALGLDLDREETAAVAGALAAALPEIAEAANDCLRRLGSADRAAVTLGRELFPTREYETFALPAGVYTSLRVTIGSGEGRNWWCVVFPSLCLSASAEDFAEAAQAAGLTEGEIRLITEEDGGYQLKFQSMELLQRLFHWLEG